MTGLDANLLAGLASRAGLGNASIVISNLTGTAGVDVDPDRLIYPASMIKLPIAWALGRRFIDGSLAPGDRVRVTAADLTANDAPSGIVVGAEPTLAECARAMLAQSDNVATNVLIDVLGRAAIGPACASAGLRATAVRRKLSGSLPLIDDPAATGRNAHPAADAARLFRAVARSAQDGHPWILDALAAQIWNDKLSRGWRAGDRFAHKTGETDEVSHDGGILTLEDGRRLVVVVYTELPSNARTDAAFASFARALRPYLDALA